MLKIELKGSVKGMRNKIDLFIIRLVRRLIQGQARRKGLKLGMVRTLYEADDLLYVVETSKKYGMDKVLKNDF